MLSEDEVLISRALAAGWKASVMEVRIPGETFNAAWLWSWVTPDSQVEYEVLVSPRDGLCIVINDELRSLFRSLDVEAPADYDLEEALIAVLSSVEHDLRWIIDSTSRERAHEAFSAAYRSLGKEMPASVLRRLQSPAVEPNGG